MEIEAIGNTSPSQADLQNDSISEQEFIQLFLAQLNFQDPLEPVDNKEFLAQLAQFSNIEQNRRNGEHLASLSFISTVNQGASLLSKNVEVDNASGSVVGKVSTVFFGESGPLLTVVSDSGDILADNVSLSQVRLIREGEE